MAGLLWGGLESPKGPRPHHEVGGSCSYAEGSKHFFKIQQCCMIFPDFFFFLTMPRGMEDLSSLAKDQTCALCIGR